jgi:integrase
MTASRSPIASQPLPTVGQPPDNRPSAALETVGFISTLTTVLHQCTPKIRRNVGASMMRTKSVLRTVAIAGARVADSKPPGRRSDAEIGRQRSYLTPAEVERLISTAKKRGRYGVRDALAILMTYRHGLRVSELVGLRWGQISWEGAPRLTVQRIKGSISGVAHPLGKDEVTALRKIQRTQPIGTLHIFTSERDNAPVSVAWFQKMLKRTGAECGLLLVHPHQLRHAAGYALADRGRDLREIQIFLGHKAISNTTKYVELAPGRLDRIWD